jgi:hypothetical protein
MTRPLPQPQPARSALFAIAVLACAAIPAQAGWNPFSPGSPIEVGPQSGQLAIADFNGDGRNDILASHPLHGRASLLLGDGRGDFPLISRSAVTFGYGPSALAAGDVNGDNRPDLAVTSRDGTTAHVHILLNVDGKFQEKKESQFAAGQVSATSWKPTLALVDVNGDKKLDVIAADGRQNAVDIFYGSGAGQFSPGQTIAVDDGPDGGFDVYTLVAGDVNGDGRLDLTVAAAMSEGDEPGRLAVLLGNDQGKLVAAPELMATIPAGARVKTLADLDGDKRADIVLTHGDSATVLVQTKDGKLAPSSASPFALGHETFAIAAVHAGYEDNDVLVAATVDSLDVVYVHEDQFHRACHSPIPAGPGAYQVAAGDLNGDGKNDVIANSFEGNALSLLLSN